jgi:hypothetical protein
MIIIISLNRFIKQPFFLNINLQKTFYNFRHTMWRFLHWVSDNVPFSRRHRTGPAEPFFLAALAAR